MNKFRKNLSGFTLIEVLLALSVFSLAGIALLSTADSHFNNLTIIENQMYAEWVAADQLVEANLARTWPPQNNKKGKIELAGRDWHWLQKVIKTNDKDMRVIEIEVRKNEDDDLPLSTLTTYVSNGVTK